MTLPVELILEGVRSARYFTVVAPLMAWGSAVYAVQIGAWWLAVPIATLAAFLSLPHVISHALAARDLWRARNRAPSESLAPKP